METWQVSLDLEHQTKYTPQGVFYGRSGFATKRGTGEGSEPPQQKFGSSPFLSCLIPSLAWLQTTYRKKVSLIVFRQILPNILPVVHIFSFIIMAYLKKFIGIKFLSTKQCPAELSPWIIPPLFPILPKMFPLLLSCLLSPPCMDCPTPSHKLWKNPRRCGENPAQQQRKCLFPTPEEFPSPNRNFYLITQYKLQL